MEGAALVLEKLVFLLLLVGAGIVAKGAGWLAPRTEEDLGKLVNNLFWPCLAFTSICAKLAPGDVVPNLILPVLAVYIIVVGLGIGWIFVQAGHYQGDEKKIFLFQSAFSNSGTLGLPLVAAFLPDKGPGMLFINNLGFTVLVWTLGVALLRGKVDRKDLVGQLLTPALVSTLVAVALVLLHLPGAIPPLVYEVTGALGTPAVPLGLLLVGAQIHTLGRKALKPTAWNLQLSLVRLVLVPLAMAATALVGRTFLGWGHDLILVFLVISLMPGSLTSVTLALTYRCSPDLAAQSVLMTHILSIATITGFLVLFQVFLMV